MICAVREDGEIFKVPFSTKQVPGSLTGEALCCELVNELSQIKPVRNNTAKTVPIKLQQCQKEKSSESQCKEVHILLKVIIIPVY